MNSLKKWTRSDFDMTVPWIEDVRRRALDRVLNAPDWSDDQRRVAHRLNQTWVLESHRTATRTVKLLASE